MKKLGLFIVAMVLMAPNAREFRADCGMGSGAGMDPYLASILDLTEDQKLRIQAKQEAFHAEMNPLREKLFSKRMELRGLWAQTIPDQGKLAAKQKEIQAIQNQIQAMTTQHRLECRELLRPEQQETLGTFVVQRGGWTRASCKIHGQ